MKTVLCYGDSNTWGYVPGAGTRFPFEVRWPGVAQQVLGSQYRIIEEGLGGRTTCWDDPITSGRNGLSYLPIVLDTHAPLDMVVIMLGTNDLKSRIGQTAFSIAQGAAKLIEIVQAHDSKIGKVLLVCPPRVVPTQDVEATLVFEGAIQKSEELPMHYRHFAKKLSCGFLDAGHLARSSAIDGIHLEAGAHSAIGRGIAEEISRIFAEA